MSSKTTTPVKRLRISVPHLPAIAKQGMPSSGPSSATLLRAPDAFVLAGAQQRQMVQERRHMVRAHNSNIRSTKSPCDPHLCQQLVLLRWPLAQI